MNDHPIPAGRLETRARMGKREVVVTANCIGCGATREIRAGEIPAGDMPMCKCGNVMIATKASAARPDDAGGKDGTHGP